MSNLGPQQQNVSYDGILQIPGGVTAQLQQVQDGEGRGTGLFLSSTGTSATTADSFVASLDAEQITDSVPRLISDGFGDYVNVKDFGAVGDGVTDDTAAIQNAINSAAYNFGSWTNGLHSRVRIPAGRYLITDTIQIGYGNPYSGLLVEGDGATYRGETGFGGTIIIANFNDRPAINIQGSRLGVIRNLALLGQNFNWILTNNLGSPAGTTGTPSPLLDDTVKSNWVDSSFPASASSVTAPYAGICIDGYAGTQPAVHYPTVNYPSWTGITTQYGKATSSIVKIEDCYIAGFVVGVVSQPSGADGNGDFITIHKTNIEFCQYGVSIGQTQSRNVALHDCVVNNVFCAITTLANGVQHGKWGGPVLNTSFFWVIQLLEIAYLTDSGPLSLINCYAEGIWRIGTISTSTLQYEQSVLFQNCEFSFSSQQDFRGVPSNIIDSVGYPTDIQFNGCHFTSVPSVMNLPLAKFEGTQLVSNLSYGGTVSYAYQALALNYLCGGFVQPLFIGYINNRIKFAPINVDTLSGVTPVFVENQAYKTTDRTYCIPFSVQNVTPTSSNCFDSVPVIAKKLTASNVISKSEFSSLVLSGKTLTGTFTSRADWQFDTLGPAPGDVIWDQATGMTFFVRSRTGTTFIAEAQNNYKSNGSGGYTTVLPFSTTIGNFYVGVSRLYTPNLLLQGTLTSGSHTMTNCGNPAYSSWYSTAIAVNDYYYVNEYYDYSFLVDQTKITAFDSTAKTITLSGNALYSQANKRLGIFVRQPPANV